MAFLFNEVSFTSGQKQVYDAVTERICTRNFPIVITGMPGTGKTLIAKKLASTSLKESQKISFEYRDSFFGNKLKQHISNLRGIFSLNSNIALLYKISLIFINFLLRRENGDIPKKIYDKLKILDKCLALYKNTVFILDEINFYSDEEIETLYYILFSDKVKNEFLNIKKIKLILLYSESYHMTEYLNRIGDMSREKSLNLTGYTHQDLECLIPDKELRKQVEDDFTQIFNLSLKSNIAVLLAFSYYIKNNRNDYYKKLLYKSISKNINKNINQEDDLKNILTATSIFPNTAIVDQIKHLAQLVYKQNTSAANSAIQRSVLKNILKTDAENLISDKSSIEFVSEEYKDYFAPKGDEEKKLFYKNYSLVLASCTPGDYYERANSYKYQSDINSYEIYYIIHLFQMFAQQVPIERQSQIDFIKESQYEKFILLMQKAYNNFHSQNSSAAFLLLEQIDRIKLPNILQFEKEYLRCQMSMANGDREKMIEIINLMNYYISLLCGDGIEKEIYVRCHSILYLAHLYNKDNVKVDFSESEIINNLDSLSRNNNKYDYYIYSLYRKSLINKSIPIAYMNSKESVNYFSIAALNNSVFYRKELFFASINHADNSRYMSNYSEAYNCIRVAQDIQINNSKLPSITLRNNYSVIAYESCKLTPNAAINQFLKPIVKDVDIFMTTESTYYIIYNNIACFYAISGKIDLV